MTWTLERLAVLPTGDWGMVVLNTIGFRNGYVRLPPGHPWIGLDWHLIPASVHGGITFTGEYPADQLDNGDGVPSGYWIGFDCGHAGDAPEPGFWPGDLESVGLFKDWHVWTTDEVWEEVIHLASHAAIALDLAASDTKSPG